MPEGGLDVEASVNAARARSYMPAADRASVELERSGPSRARRRSSRRGSAELELIASLRMADVADDELEHVRGSTGDDEHHGSTGGDATYRRRRLSARLGTQQQQQQQQNRVGGTALRRDFDAFIERLHRDGTREAAAVERLMREWQTETFGREPDPLARLRMYEEFVRSVLPTYIAGHVETTKTANFLGAFLTALTVLLTWGDTVTDWIMLEQLLMSSSVRLAARGRLPMAEGSPCSEQQPLTSSRSSTGSCSSTRLPRVTPREVRKEG